MMNYKKLICEVGERLYKSNLVSAHDGNISVRVGDRVFITPTSTSKGFMNENQIATMDLAGNLISSDIEPSSEYRLHLAVYNKRDSINAVIHAHPITATAFSVVGRSIDRFCTAEAKASLGIIPLAEYAPPGDEKIVDTIDKYINDHNGVLLSNHGVILWSEELIKTLYMVEQLEHYCKTVYIAESIGKIRYI